MVNQKGQPQLINNHSWLPTNHSWLIIWLTTTLGLMLSQTNRNTKHERCNQLRGASRLRGQTSWYRGIACDVAGGPPELRSNGPVLRCSSSGSKLKPTRRGPKVGYQERWGGHGIRTGWCSSNVACYIIMCLPILLLILSNWGLIWYE